MRTVDEILIDEGNAAGNLTSKPQTLEQALGYMAQAVITGDPVGTLKLQGSCDFGTDTIGAGVVNWEDVRNSAAPVTGAGSVVWNVRMTFYKWMRVIYTAESGTGNITVTVNTKG